jgi:hypothetical protein
VVAVKNIHRAKRINNPAVGRNPLDTTPLYVIASFSHVSTATYATAVCESVINGTTVSLVLVESVGRVCFE